MRTLLHLATRAFGAAALCVVPLVAQESRDLEAGEASTASPVERDAVRLLRLLRDPQGPSAADLAGDFAALGIPLLPAAADWLRERRIPGHDGAGEMALSVYQEELLLLAAERWGRPAVLGWLGEEPAGERDVPERAVAIQLLGAAGAAGDFERIAALARVEGETSIPRPIASRLAGALTRLVRRDPETCDVFADELGRNRSDAPGLLQACVVAVGDARRPRGLTFLHQLASWNDDLIDLVLAQVKKLGPSLDADVNRRLAIAIRRHLDPHERTTCQAAVLALAELQDFDSMEEMIELLDVEDEGLRQNVHWALVELTGQRLSPQRDLWLRWLKREEAWFGREEYLAFKNLHSPDEGTVAKAIRVVSARRLRRHDLARGLTTTLSHPSERIRLLTISALRELDSPMVVPELIEALEDSRPAVVDAAWKALTTLTGEQLAQDPDVWRQAFPAT